MKRLSQSKLLSQEKLLESLLIMIPNISILNRRTNGYWFITLLDIFLQLKKSKYKIEKILDKINQCDNKNWLVNEIANRII